jgi:hypothetical protein
MPPRPCLRTIAAWALVLLALLLWVVLVVQL